jgi:hypothetical protein
MPKTFYTDRDIEDLVKRGVSSLVVDDDVVLTDLARDKAMRLGLALTRDGEKPPSAPERPYITDKLSPSATSAPAQPTAKKAKPSREDLHNRVREAVVARLGDTVDPKLLDTIIRRVLQNVSVK